MLRILTVAAALLLGGCFPATKEALKAEAAQKWQLELQENYQAVYRRLAERMRECMQSAWIGDQVVVNADLYTDLRRAELAVEGINALTGRRLQLLVELEALEERRTRVLVFEPMAPKPSAIVRKWATGELQRCGTLADL